ncbi:BTB/POZ fold domain containing protein [Cordyceps fumosorosea ARSEF 2679]|uniref:BTB/POZ fold domain containing protein n=1 Tax=Cordyceps fumosorosea (strain ARSEF 2679) TaxID=1081104 RepID=A0A168ESZ6_CORFA|nr:BTB/POZ fold domain containing protein [Cordyceps fumosorosea ARSEF 2679]OAA74177.1 BTB/POZ fold domain containing protein [Cordyceps fumosorosea ARSEF 2679]
MDAFAPESVRRFRQFMYTQDYDMGEIEVKRAEGAKKSDEAKKADKGAKAASGDSTPAQGAEPSSAGKKEVESEHHENHPGLQDPVLQTILAHTRMNAMGDYDVPSLVALANVRVAATMAAASPDAPWIAGLPAVAEVALGIVDSAGIVDALTGTISENLAALLAVGALEASPLVTPFCLTLLRPCNATNQALAEHLAYRSKTLKEVGKKYTEAAEQVVQQRKAVSALSTARKCRAVGCAGRFDCYFAEGTSRLRCRLCHSKH